MKVDTGMMYLLEFSQNGTVIQWILENLKNHWSSNGGQFKDPISHICLAGTASTTLVSNTRDTAGLSPFTLMTNISISEVSEFNYNS